jgi:uncharacterized protein (TIGR02284 family)
MEISEKALDVINELIEINNDRVAGFAKAALNDEDKNIHTIFNKLEAESLGYVNELTAIARQSSGNVAKGTSISGDLHRAWTNLITAFAGDDRMAILEECERSEETAKAAYRDVLNLQNDIDPELLLILKKQQEGIDTALGLVKSLRDDERTITDSH